MRRKIAAGNWKMIGTQQEGERILHELKRELMSPPLLSPYVSLVIAPPAPFIPLAIDFLKRNNLDMIQVAAQNCSKAESGAFTGQVSAGFFRSLGVKMVILGHSEQRQYFPEDNTDAIIKIKSEMVLRQGMTVILCVGENLGEREQGRHFDVVKKQVEAPLEGLTSGDLYKFIIAYEPVWAIGTNKSASPEMAQEMHKFIRSLIAKKFGDKAASEIPVLYGGSCKADNARGLFAMPDIDGGLIGGASLKAEEFKQIANSF